MVSKIPDDEELQRLIGGWKELNVYLSRCYEAELCLPLLRHAVLNKARWAVVERVWQRYRVLSGTEERDLLRVGLLPERLKEGNA